MSTCIYGSYLVTWSVIAAKEAQKVFVFVFLASIMGDYKGEAGWEWLFKVFLKIDS